MLLVDAKGILCKSRKYPYPAQGKSMEIPRGKERVVSKAKVLKEMYEAEHDFSEDGWLQTIKTPSIGGVWNSWSSTVVCIILQINISKVQHFSSRVGSYSGSY